MESENNVFKMNTNESLQPRYEELLMTILKAKEEMKEIAEKLNIPVDREAMFADEIIIEDQKNVA